MSSNTALVQVQGETVNALRLQGKDYVPVHVRIESAHRNGAEAKIGYEMVSHEFLTVGNKDVVRICIAIQGKKFFGSAQIMWGGKGADATNPIENAETSALGRALGAGGFDIQNGIATGEDVQRAMNARQVRVVESKPTPISANRQIQQPPADQEPPLAPPANKTWKEWTEALGKRLGIFDTLKDYLDCFQSVTGVNPRGKDIPVPAWQKWAHYLLNEISLVEEQKRSDASADVVETESEVSADADSSD